MSGYTVFFGIYFGVPAALLVLYCVLRIWIIERGTAMVVERWGRFHRCCYAGWHFLVPFADRPRGVTWRVSEIERRNTVRDVWRAYAKRGPDRWLVLRRRSHKRR